MNPNGHDLDLEEDGAEPTPLFVVSMRRKMVLGVWVFSSYLVACSLLGLSRLEIVFSGYETRYPPLVWPIFLLLFVGISLLYISLTNQDKARQLDHPSSGNEVGKGKCLICEKSLYLPLRCRRCGKTYCVRHLPPGKHECEQRREAFIDRYGRALLVTVIIVVLATAGALTLIKSRTRYYDLRPSIWGEIVVWESDRHTDKKSPDRCEIYLYNLTAQREIRLTKNPANKWGPHIYESKVVWADNRSGNWDIYLMDLKTGTESQLTSDPSIQDSPLIYGDNVVWRDLRNGNSDVYMLNLLSGHEKQLTDDPTSQIPASIYGDLLIWKDSRNGNVDLCIYDLAESVERFLTTNPASQLSPSMWEDQVVWQDNRTGYWEIFIYNLTSAEERQITSNQGYNRNPSIYRDIITWSSLRFGDTWDIYVHNLSTGETKQITEEGKPWRNHPKVFDNIVVWDEGMRYREVYSYDLKSGEQQILSSP